MDDSSHYLPVGRRWQGHRDSPRLDSMAAREQIRTMVQDPDGNLVVATGP
ncbi:hypothetical protein [Arthrobacter sp. Leaf337]|nr:hypothetical protein [Arthrobacter sp. Leaf337]